MHTELQNVKKNYTEQIFQIKFHPQEKRENCDKFKT